MKNGCKISFLIIIILCWSGSGANVNAQNKNIDSLLTLLKNDIPDTNKVIHLYQLASESEFALELEKGINYGTEALELARKLNFKNGIAQSSNNIGRIYRLQANYHQALECFIMALHLYEELNNKKAIESLFLNIGNVYADKGDYPKTIENYLMALKIAEGLDDKKIQAYALSNIGNVYRSQLENEKALDYYLKALKISEKISNKQMQASILCNIGLSYQGQKDYPTALDCYFKALKISNELKNKNLISIILGNIGGTYSLASENSKAIEYYFKGLKLAEELGDKQGIAIKLGNIGSLYITQKKFAEAEKILLQALAIDTAINFLSHTQFTYDLLSTVFENAGKPGKALEYYKKAMVVKDTLFYADKNKEIVRKTMNYEFEKKEAITKAENEKQQAIAQEKSRKQKLVLVLVSCVLILVFVFAGFIFRSLRITRKQKQTIEIKNTETEQQKKVIEEKNKDITDSIRYAKRIQDALMGEKEHISKHLPEHFILFMPKDIVSGDFHWGAEKQGHWYFAAVDCTGHGVPGAVMSMLGISFLNDIVASEKLFSPAEVLNHLRDKIVKELRQTGEAGGSKDGMDISLCRLNLKTNELQWAGAYNPLNLFRNGQLEELKADKQPIGYHPENRPFTNHQIQLQKGDSIYLYSDGYADQFGGSKGKKFKYKQLDDLIKTYNHLPLKDQKEILKNRFTEWKGSLEQVDDVCVFGVRV